MTGAGKGDHAPEGCRPASTTSCASWPSARRPPMGTSDGPRPDTDGRCPEGGRSARLERRRTRGRSRPRQPRPARSSAQHGAAAAGEERENRSRAPVPLDPRMARKSRARGSSASCSPAFLRYGLGNGGRAERRHSATRCPSCSAPRRTPAQPGTADTDSRRTAASPSPNASRSSEEQEVSGGWRRSHRAPHRHHGGVGQASGDGRSATRIRGSVASPRQPEAAHERNSRSRSWSADLESRRVTAATAMAPTTALRGY